MISPNGAPPAPAPPGRAPASPRQTTTFLPLPPFDTWSLRLYALTRLQALGISLRRWLNLLLLAFALLWGVLALPGGWGVSLLWLSGAAMLFVLMHTAQRRQFTAFRPHQQPPLAPRRMSPAEKRAVYVTGALRVEQKVRTFTALPGFYRTFATREHALLCQVQARTVWSFAAWPEDEIGLWYAFFTPDHILDIQPGVQQIGRQTLPALAITIRPAQTGAKRRQPAMEVLYLAFLDASDFAAVRADLMIEWRTTPTEA